MESGGGPSPRQRRSRGRLTLEREWDDREAEAALLRDSVATLERARRGAQLTVRRIRRTSDLQRRLEQTFPEMAASAWGLTTIPLHDDDTVGIEYFLMPAWFTETFIIDHQNAESWRRQKDKLLAVDSLEFQVAVLQDSILQLERQKFLAVDSGYSEAFASYQELSDRYITELSKPRVSLGTAVGFCLGAIGAGLIVGALIND